MIQVSTHKYTVHSPLSKALEAVVAEERAASARGWMLIGFQVVEAERVVVVMYRMDSGAPRAVLTGE